MTEMQIPDFLRRTPKKDEPHMTTTQPEPVTTTKAPRKPRRDAYVARLTISVPLDMADSETLAKAVKAVAGVNGNLPHGSTVEVASAGLGKMAAE